MEAVNKCTKCRLYNPSHCWQIRAATYYATYSSQLFSYLENFFYLICKSEM